MQSKTMQKIATNFYLFLIALYFLLASAHLINILINLSVKGSIAPYFEFINASIDRTIFYALNLVTMLYIIFRNFTVLPVLPLFGYILAGYLASMPVVDILQILISFLALVWLLTSLEPLPMMKRKKAVSSVAIYLILILIVVEISTFVCWFIFPFYPKLSQVGTFKYLVDLETKMFMLTACLAPVFTVIFLFSWTTKPFLSRFNFLKKLPTLFNLSNSDSNNTHRTRIHLGKRSLLLLLTCSIILSFLVTFYPYTPTLNTDAHLIGVDILDYEKWITNSTNKDFFSAVANFFSNASTSDRPISLLILYLAKSATGFSSLTIIKFFPLILGPALVLAVYFFMRETSDFGYIHLLAAFLTISSFHISVGMWAFFLSNWMALIEFYLLMGFYFSSLRKKSYLRMSVAVLLSISLLFTHSWTWGMAIGIFIVYLLFTAISKRKKINEYRFEILMLIILILANVLVGIARNYALGLSAGDFATLKMAQTDVSAGPLVFYWEDLLSTLKPNPWQPCSRLIWKDALVSFWDSLLYTFSHTMYGFFLNPMALFLAVLGAFTVIFDDKPVNRYLSAWLVASSIFFASSSEFTIKSRILFNAPLPVFEALGLAGILSVIKKVFEPNTVAFVKLSIILFVLLVSLNYAFRCAFIMSI